MVSIITEVIMDKKIFSTRKLSYILQIYKNK